MNQHAIRVSRLTVIRGGRTVLEDLDVDIGRGTVTGLLGPSGCGKSTLLRAIVGVQKVASGSLTVLGQPAGSRGLRKRVAYVTQAPSIYSDITVEENLAYFASVLGAPEGSVARAISLVGLDGSERAMAGRLSGGQRSRVSLAAALLGEPDLLVLDEPTVGLDPVLREELWRTFHALATAGATLLVSSHVMDEAERCDRLILMREGRVIANETPTAVKASVGSASVEEAFLSLVRERGAA